MHARPVALESLSIISPCAAPWDSMPGDNRVRFCGQCNLHVYNLSGMTREEAETLVGGQQERMCVRMLKRSGGSVQTQDDFDQSNFWRRGLARIWSRAASLIGLLTLGLERISNKCHGVAGMS